MTQSLLHGLPDREGHFTIIHTCVDGAGSDYPSFSSFHAAIQHVENLQVDVDSARHGNQWRYTYTVYEYGRPVYHTSIDEAKYQRGCLQMSWDTCIEQTIRNAILDAHLALSNITVKVACLPEIGHLGLHTLALLEPYQGEVKIVINELFPQVWQAEVLELPPLHPQDTDLPEIDDKRLARYEDEQFFRERGGC
jgi:hypothetical protein